MLASLDAATPEADIRPPQPDATCSNSPTRWRCRIRRRRASFHKIEPQDDIEFSERAAARASHRQPAYEPPPFESAEPPAQQILSRSTVSAVEVRL